MATQRFGVCVEKEYLNFSSAHFLVFDEHKRECLHGHNYYVAVELVGELQPAWDLFVDFRDLKRMLKQICDELDHKVLLQTENPFLVVKSEKDKTTVRFGSEELFVFPTLDVKFLPLRNTTAELLAEYVLDKTMASVASEYPRLEIQRAECSVEETKGQAGVIVREF